MESTHRVEQSGDPSTGALISQLSEQSVQLIREELQLAQAETNAKVKHGITGVASFGAAGLLGLYGLGVLLAAAVLGLAEAVPAWLSALIVGVVLVVVAGVAALVGKKEAAEVSPVVPEKAVSGVKQDVATIKGGTHE